MARSRRTKAEEGAENQNPEHEEESTEEPAAPPPRRSKRKKVMTASSQTDAERRQLRIKQRSLKSLLTSNSQLSEQIADVSTDKFSATREQNNKMFGEVYYTREAVLDAENLELISNRCARQVDKLVEIPRYDVEKFIQKLKKNCSDRDGASGNGGGFMWHTFGYEVGSCFNQLPSNVSFLNGTIDAEYEPKQRKKAERRKRENTDHIEEEEVGSIQQKKKSKDEDKLSAAEAQVKNVRKLLIEKSTAHVEERYSIHEEKFGLESSDWGVKEKTEFKNSNRDKGEIDGVQFLFNPKSFTQTVENLFSLSFLVKKGDARLGVRKPEDCEKSNSDLMRPGFYVKPKSSSGRTQMPPSKQAIVSLSMADWKAMVAAHKIDDADIPHRGKSKYAKKASSNK